MVASEAAGRPSAGKVTDSYMFVWRQQTEREKLKVEGGLAGLGFETSEPTHTNTHFPKGHTS